MPETLPDRNSEMFQQYTALRAFSEGTSKRLVGLIQTPTRPLREAGIASINLDLRRYVITSLNKTLI